MRKVLSAEFSVSSQKESEGRSTFPVELAPESKEIESLRGKIYGLVSIVGKERTFRDRWLAVLEESYFSNLAGTPLGALRQAVSKLEALFGATGSESGVGVNFCLVVVWGEVLYLTVRGEVGVKLVRHGERYNLFDLKNAQRPQFLSGNISGDDSLELGVGPRDTATILFTTKEIISNEETVHLEPVSSPSPVVYLHREGRKKWPIITTAKAKLIIGLLVALLLMGTGFTLVKSRNKSSPVSEKIAQATQKMTESLALKGVNDKLAKEGLTFARDILLSIPKPQHTDQVSKLLTKIESEITETSGVVKIAASETFFDLNLAKEGLVDGVVDYSQGKFYILDKASGAIVGVSEKTKASSVVGASGDFKDGKFISVSWPNVFVFLPSGIGRLNAETKKKDLIIKKGDYWNSVVGMTIYSGNPYWLDTQSGQVWKYSGAGQEKSYFPKPSETAKLATTIFIDGSVYLVTSTGKISRFTSAQEDDFLLTGFDGGFKEVKSIQVGSKTGRIFVWDRVLKAVAVFDNNGKYQRVYYFPENYNQVFINDEETKVYGYFQSTIKSFPISN